MVFAPHGFIVMQAETIGALLDAAVHRLEKIVSECAQKLREYKNRIAVLEAENAELKRTVGGSNEVAPQQSLVSEVVSSDIEISLSQLKDILNLRKK